MRKTHLLFFLFISMFHFASGQQTEIDSLEKIIDKIEDPKLKGKKIASIYSTYRGKEPDIALYFIRKSIQHNIKYKDSIKLGYALGNLGNFYNNNNNTDSAIIIHKQTQELFKKIDFNKGQCASFSALADDYIEKRDYVNSINQSLRALECIDQHSSDYTKEQVIVQKNRVKITLGITYSSMGDEEKAQMYWNEVINDTSAKENSKNFTSAYTNLCISYRKSKQFDKAIKYGILAVNSTNKPRRLYRASSSLASAYSVNQNYDKAFLYYSKCLEISEKLKDNVLLQRTNHNIGYLFKNKGDYKTASKYFLSSIKEIKKQGNLKSLENSYHGLFENFLAQKDYKNALENYRQMHIIKDSIFGIEKQKAFSDLEVKYETDKTKKEKSIAENNTRIALLESAQNRNLFIGSIILALLIFFASLFYYSRLKSRKNAELSLIELNEAQNRLVLEKQQRDSELKALKAQMNPHFIFNALTSIQEYVVTKQTRQASDYLAKFADLIRSNLHYSDTGYLTITEEVENLKLYLDLEKFRFEGQLDYSFEVDEALDPDRTDIPTMLIQPYIENALKHGLLHKPEDRKLLIGVSKISNSAIECIVEDNGIGREASQLIKKRRGSLHKSFALKATSERLDLLNHGKDNKISVEIIDLKKDNIATGTRVVLRIPILD